MTRTVVLTALCLSLVACGGEPGADPDSALADTASPLVDASVSPLDASTPTPDAPGLDASGLDAPGLDAWSPDAALEPGTDAAGSDTPEDPPEPLQLAITVHLESGGAPVGTSFTPAWWDGFEDLVTIFEAHGAVLTLEPRVDALAGQGPTRLTALRARGHEIGLHAAVGDGTYEMFADQLRTRRAMLEAAVGPIEHVSGNCGTFDWVGGIAGAGFQFTTAATVGCLLSIPVSTRPDEYDALMCRGFADPVCHRAYPDTSEGTVHAWRAASGASWLTDDASGSVVMLPSRGTLDCIVEEMSGGPAGSCVLRDDDITIALSELDEAVRVRDPSRPAQLYWVWSYGRALDPAALDRFLSAVDERVARAEVEWATANDAYHSFVAWEATHR